MNIGDHVQVTQSWLDNYISTRRLSGTVTNLRKHGAHPAHPERTVFVTLDEQIGPFDGLWFAPEDLEIINDGS